MLIQATPFSAFATPEGVKPTAQTVNRYYEWQNAGEEWSYQVQAQQDAERRAWLERGIDTQVLPDPRVLHDNAAEVAAQEGKTWGEFATEALGVNMTWLIAQRQKSRALAERLGFDPKLVEVGWAVPTPCLQMGVASLGGRKFVRGLTQ